MLIWTTEAGYESPLGFDRNPSDAVRVPLEPRH